MAGVKFPFKSLPSLLQLNIGLSNRFDENRAESFVLMYCDFSDASKDLIASSLAQCLRTSDAYVQQKGHYFFILPFTDKYGATIVKNMFEEFFAFAVPSKMISYSVDGESTKELLETLQAQLLMDKIDLEFLDYEKLI